MDFVIAWYVFGKLTAVHEQEIIRSKRLVGKEKKSSCLICVKNFHARRVRNLLMSAKDKRTSQIVKVSEKVQVGRLENQELHVSLEEGD